MTEVRLTYTPWTRWSGRACIVAASGPGLTEHAANLCQASGLPIVAVNDAYRVLPRADILYACDAGWWHAHGGAPDFAGEKWSCHEAPAATGPRRVENDKSEAQAAYGLSLIAGRDAEGFSFDPGYIHYGGNSGFQAINLALLMGARRVILAGFNMAGRSHFFGAHPPELDRGGDYGRFVPAFAAAARLLPPGIEIINCTPGSALTCFPAMPLDQALGSLAA